MYLHWFVDVDHQELDLEGELSYLSGELQVLRSIFLHCQTHGFSDCFVSHMFMILDSVVDCSGYLLNSFNFCSVSDDVFFSVTQNRHSADLDQVTGSRKLCDRGKGSTDLIV